MVEFKRVLLCVQGWCRDDPSFRLEGPHLLHHRQTTLTEQATYKESLWQHTVGREVHLPTLQIQLYDASGKPVRRIEFDATLGHALPAIHTEDILERPMENSRLPQTETLDLSITPQHQTSFQGHLLSIMGTFLEQCSIA